MKFGEWRTEAIRGYVVMLGEFLSGSMQEDAMRQSYVSRLADAKAELKLRDDAESGKKVSVFFTEEQKKDDEPVEPVPS